MSNFTTTITLGPGRVLSDSEKLARDEYLRTQLAAGLLITDDPTDFEVRPVAGVRVWTTEAAANAFIAWCIANLHPNPVAGKVEAV